MTGMSGGGRLTHAPRAAQQSVLDERQDNAPRLRFAGKHFALHGFEFILLPSRVHARPHAGTPLAPLGDDVTNR